MKNKCHQRTQISILLVCLTILTIITIQQLQTTTEAHTIAEKRYKPELVIQTGHTRGVDSVAFSPDGKIIASGSGDATIKLWNAESGQQIKSFDGHENSVYSIAFSPDGKKLFSASSDNTVKLWNIETGQQIKSFDSIYSVAFSPDGKTFASESSDDTVKLWNIETGQQIKSFDVHTESVNVVSLSVETIAFSPDGRMLAFVGKYNKTVKLWSIETGQQIKSFDGHTDSITEVVFSPDGKTLASGSYDKTVKLWNIETGQQIKTFIGHTDSVHLVAFSPDGKTLVSSGGSDKSVRLWSIETGQQIKSFEGPEYSADAVAFSPDGKTLATSEINDKTIILWNIKTGQQIKSLEGHTDSVNSVAFSLDGKTIASGNGDATKLWNVETGQQIKSLNSYEHGVMAVAFSPDGKTIASGGWDETVKLWNIETGQQIKSLDVNNNKDESVAYVYSVAFSPNGKILASGSYDGNIKLWNVETGQQIKSLNAHDHSVSSVAFSPDGKTLVSGSYDYIIKLWNVETGRQIKSLEGHTNYIQSVSFSPDEKTIASGSTDHTVKLWSIDTGQQIKSFEGHTSGVESVVFSPDGKILASGGSDNSIKLWNIENGQQFKSFEGHTSSVGSVTFSPDGKFLLSGSADATIKLWSLQDNKLLSSLISLDNDDWVVTTPNGNFDASPESLKLMHFVVFVLDSGYEVITLDQLKSRSLTPGLLRDIYSGKTSSGANDFTITLYPSVEIEQSKEKANLLNLKLKNRGGGIGKVEIYLNGTEFLADAREGKSVKTDAATVDLAVEIPKEKLNAGANKIEVITWNTEGDVRSRSHEYFLNLDEKGTVRGTKVFSLQEKPQTYDGHFYAIVAGVSDYAGDFDLGFAAKDAEDMSRALALGARRLFCGKELAGKKPCERVHVRLLSTEKETAFEVADVDFKRALPKKADFEQVFREIAARAKPEDVVVVYFAGHGLAMSSNEALAASAFPDLYIFPTMDAATLDKKSLGNRDLMKANYVTSLELADWMKEIRAQKKAMIFDTCASGAVQTDLAKLSREDGDEDKLKIRALDRLRERTGFYVLMGSAADAVSYEAGKFRQGLLTYSLLSAMSGEKLRDEKFVDVEDWFKYAEETVDVLAKDIGGIQRPRWFKSNFNTQSFDVGQYEQKDYENFKLAQPVPTILQPRFLDKVNISDTLKLEQAIISKLRESSINTGRGAENAIKFVPVAQAKGGISVSGLYTVSDENVVVELALRQDEKEIAKLEVKGTKTDIAEKIFQAIILSAQGRKP